MPPPTPATIYSYVAGSETERIALEAIRGRFTCLGADLEPVPRDNASPKMLSSLVLLVGMVGGDPAWALGHRDWLGSLTEGLAASLLGQWAEQSPAAATAWSTGLESQSERLQAVGRCIAAIGATDPEKALALHRQFPEAAQRVYLESDDVRVLNPVAAALAKRDGVRALAEISTWGEDETYLATLHAAECLTIPPEGPAALLDQLADVRERDPDTWNLIRQHLYAQWKPKDWAAAVGTTLAWDDTEYETRKTREDLLKRWSRDSWKDAAQWVADLANDRTQSTLSSQLAALGLQEPDPRPVLDWMATQGVTLTPDQLEETHFTAATLRQLAAWTADAENKAACNPEILAKVMTKSLPVAEVVDWINSLPDVAVQTRAVTGMAAEWGDEAPTEARQWIDSLPEGPVRDAAIKALPRFSPTTTLSTLPKP